MEIGENNRKRASCNKLRRMYTIHCIRTSLLTHKTENITNTKFAHYSAAINIKMGRKKENSNSSVFVVMTQKNDGI